jgi:hypothetical protein
LLFIFSDRLTERRVADVVPDGFPLTERLQAC